MVPELLKTWISIREHFWFIIQLEINEKITVMQTNQLASCDVCEWLSFVMSDVFQTRGRFLYRT